MACTSCQQLLLDWVACEDPRCPLFQMEKSDKFAQTWPRLMAWEDQTTRCCGITYHKAGPAVVKLVVPRRPPGPDTATRQLASDAQYLSLSEAIAKEYPEKEKMLLEEEMSGLPDDEEEEVLALQNMMQLQ